MSMDPARLFDDPDVPENLRGALRQMAEHAPETYDQTAGLARLQAAIGSGGGDGGASGGGAGESGASGGTSALGAGKTLALGVGALGLAGALVAGALALPSVERESATPPSSVARPALSAPAVASVEERDETPLITPEALPAASEPKAARSAPVSKETLYREELEHLAALRRVAASQPAQGVRMADEGHARFARGMLYQEREAIAVRCLVQSGQAGAARARAERFLARFPKSPFADQVRLSVGLSKP